MNRTTCPGCGRPMDEAGDACCAHGGVLAAGLQPTEALPVRGAPLHTVLIEPSAVPELQDAERPPASLPLQSGLPLNGRYRIARLLGQGGMGAVYLARDANLADRECAVKELIDPALPGQGREQALLRFAREAEVLAELNHPGIPQVYDRFCVNGRYYIVMEYVGGLNLGQLLRLYLQEQGRPLPESEVARWVLQLCDALEYLHRHVPPVIHRDVKPDNLILLRDGRVKLVDFGIARAVATGRDTALGTAGYAPPEQYRGQTSPQSDLYAMGACMHHLVTGADPQQRAPFDFPMLARYRPDVNPVLQHLVAELLSINPLDRPQSIGSVRAELRAAYPQVDLDRPNGTEPVVAAIVSRELGGSTLQAISETRGQCPVCGALRGSDESRCCQCGVSLSGPASELRVAAGQGTLTFPLVAGYWARRQVERVALIDEAGHMTTAFLLGITSGDCGRYAFITHGAGVAEGYLFSEEQVLQAISFDQWELAREMTERYRDEFSPDALAEEGRSRSSSEVVIWIAAAVTAAVVLAVWVLSLRP
ncbi:MAG: serine/threonine-protein kinase [Mycobacterium leprae]